MWPRIRTLLWAHALASWAAFGVLWMDTLRQPGRPPLDGKFWLVFGLTEGFAPVWLPVSIIVYRPVFNPTAATIAVTYILVGTIACLWLWRRQPRKIARARRSAGQCQRCGYDLRATPDRCPECGTPRDRSRPSANLAVG